MCALTYYLVTGFIVLVAGFVGMMLPAHFKPTTRTPVDGFSQATMRAAVYTEYGSPANVLKVVSDRPVPSIAQHEVLVKVMAAGLNPIDYKKMEGAMFMLEMLTGDLRGAGSVPGFDIAGRVVAVGAGCERLKVGDEVFAMAFALQTGALAEFVAVPETLASLKPKNISFTDAASLPLAGLTSLQALRDWGQLQPSEDVMVLGGSGGTGTLAVQIAKALGAGKVSATCSPRNKNLLKSLGADTTVDYKREDWPKHPGIGNVTLVFDCVGGSEQYIHARRTLHFPLGRFVTIVGDHQAAFTPPYLIARGIEIAARKFSAFIHAGPKYDFITTNTNHEDLDELARMVTEGAVKSVVDRTYPLVKVVDAFEYLAGGHASGKVVVRVAEDDDADGH